jgi:hypothetical protein
MRRINDSLDVMDMSLCNNTPLLYTI